MVESNFNKFIKQDKFQEFGFKTQSTQKMISYNYCEGC